MSNILGAMEGSMSGRLFRDTKLYFDRDDQFGSSHPKSITKIPIESWSANLNRRGPGAGGGTRLSAVSVANIRNGSAHDDLEGALPLGATSFHSTTSPTMDQKDSTGFSTPQPAWEATPAAAAVAPHHRSYHHPYVSTSPPTTFDDASTAAGITITQQRQVFLS